MKRNTLGIVAAVVIAAIATAVLVTYVRDAKDKAVAGEKLVDVLVASKAISAGTAASDLRDATTMERVPAKTRPDGALQSLHQVKNLVTSTDLVTSEILLRDRFVPAGQLEKGVTEIKVPEGFLEITLKLNPEQDVGGQIKPNGRVAIFLPPPGSDPSAPPNPADLAFRDVLVTNTQYVSSSKEPSSADQTKSQAPTRTILVTLAVSAPDAQVIVAHQLSGDISASATCKCYLGAESGTPSTTLGTGSTGASQ
jgi:pilus assembly protein CpaB